MLQITLTADLRAVRNYTMKLPCLMQVTLFGHRTRMPSLPIRETWRRSDAEMIATGLPRNLSRRSTRSERKVTLVFERFLIFAFT